MDLDVIFSYHPPKGGEPLRYHRIRDGGRRFAEVIAKEVPDCPEQATAIQKLQEAVMWANAGIARNREECEGTE